jgi:hypothetical protein
MTETRSRPAELGAATEDPTIRPFQGSVPDEDLAKLCRRLALARWPSKELVDRSGWQGIYDLRTNNGPGTVSLQFRLTTPGRKETP